MRAPHISERRTSAYIATLNCYSSISLQYDMSSTSYDARVVLALNAIQNTKNLSIRAAAKIQRLFASSFHLYRILRPNIGS